MCSRAPAPQVLATYFGATCCLFRVSIDVIRATYNDNHKNFNRLLKYSDANPTNNKTSKKEDSTLLKNIGAQDPVVVGTFRNHGETFLYGTFDEKQPQSSSPVEVSAGEEFFSSLRPLILNTDADMSTNDELDTTSSNLFAKSGGIRAANSSKFTKISTISHLLILAFFLLDLKFSSLSTLPVMFTIIYILCTSFSSFTCIILNLRDPQRQRFSSCQRLLYIASSAALLYGGLYAVVFDRDYESFLSETSSWDLCALVALVMYLLVSLWECKMCPYPSRADKQDETPALSRKAIFTMLRPYFWPDAVNDSNTYDSAMLNRVRAILTYVCVALAKVCTLFAPILIGRASTALSRSEYHECLKYSVIYSTAIFTANFLKEAQGLLYLKVSQTAFVQLSEIVFYHLHSLSLDWHLNKKLGEVIRSMDRGISACDSIMKFLFLRLVPTITECIMVVIIFASYFKHFALSVAVFLFVFIYAVLTIVLTLWRRRFRKNLSKSDNDWHGRCTDSLMNFETVKYFTAEKYEMVQFSDTVKRYQRQNVAVEASISLLNVLQSFLFQACLFTSLALSAMDIKCKMDCCVQKGCAGNSLCCSEIADCPGMAIGDFVSVFSYVIQLFTPLNFLGSIYQTIVMATVDLSNLLAILAVMPEVRDAPDAMKLSAAIPKETDIAVEFENVSFHYPSQDGNQGLKNVSFKMRRGTVTAIVGHTGSGKTTLSRLLFRFYDVNQGAIRVNGVDVRAVTQKSLREQIGVVPQSAELFNDSIRNNILYGKRNATDEELQRVIKAAQLDRFIASLPNGWHTIVGDRGLRLSGGEKQRTAIARCLLKDPPFLVLDEATSSLDSLTESSVQDALDELRNERTCLVVAHRLGTIRNADNIIVLSNGQIIEQGIHEELLAKNGVYAEMWSMQLHTPEQDYPSQSDVFTEQISRGT